VFTNNTASYCGVATDARNHNAVKVFPVVIQYFDWKNGGSQSKLIEVQQQSNEAAETVAQYIKGTPENHGLLRKCFAFAGDNCTRYFGDCGGMPKH
jgi:hypothetical protein